MPEESYYNPLDCRTRSTAITAFVIGYLLFATVQPSGGLPPVIKIGKFPFVDLCAENWMIICY
jgi:hypothetical protein